MYQNYPLALFWKWERLHNAEDSSAHTCRNYITDPLFIFMIYELVE